MFKLVGIAVDLVQVVVVEIVGMGMIIRLRVNNKFYGTGRFVIVVVG